MGSDAADYSKTVGSDRSFKWGNFTEEDCQAGQETAPWVECLLCQHRNLRLESGGWCKKPDVVAHTVIPALGRRRRVDPGAPCLTGLIELMNSVQWGRDRSLKDKELLGKTLRLLHSYSHMKMWIHGGACTQTRTSPTQRLPFMMTIT